jgi:hypothetical protein
MKHFQLFVALLVSASLISAAAHSEACSVSRSWLNDIIREGDSPEDMVTAFGDCWTFSWNLVGVFGSMIQKGRLLSLGICLSQLKYQTDNDRDQFLNLLLGNAMRSGNWQATDVLLAQRFNTKNRNYMYLPFELAEMKELVKRHPEYASDLAPLGAAFRYIRNAADGSNLIELAHCCEEAKPGSTVATDMLEGLLGSNLGDADIASIAEQLIQMGAQISKYLLDHLNQNLAGFEKTKALLNLYYEFQGDGVKEPGSD